MSVRVCVRALDPPASAASFPRDHGRTTEPLKTPFPPLSLSCLRSRSQLVLGLATVLCFAAASSSPVRAMPSSPRRTAHSHANRTLPSEKPLTASPAQLTHPSSPSSAPSSVHSVPFSLHSSHLRRRADGPTSDRPADLFAASDYAHHAAGVALFGPAPRSPLVGQELERARLRDKYALRPEQEEVLGRMMRGVWERLGGGPLEGSATAAGPRPRGALSLPLKKCLP